MLEIGPFDAIGNLGADELRLRLRSLIAIIERAPVPIAIAHDPDCRIITANRALARLLRVPPDVNISLTPPPGEKAPYKIQHEGEDVPSDVLPMQYAIAHRTTFSNEIEIVRDDGSVLHVQNDIEPLYDMHGDVYGCVSVCVDITDRKLAEMALRDADRRKDEFLATLSHELRNPLAPIRAALEVMRRGRGDQDLVDKARTTMERQMQHLVRLTDDLLDVARITQNKIDLRRSPIDLRTVLQSAIEGTTPLMEARAHTLTLRVPERPLQVDGDFTRLTQAFANILNNAAKYTDHGGRITVTVEATAETITAAVEDSGAGIPPAMLPHIFDMFTQLQEHRDRTQGGLGIGLALTRRLIELHGGSIDAASDGPGRGSTFTIRLPALVASAAVAVASPAAEVGRGPARRVLVADDNPDTTEMMRVMLELSGHEVEVAGDGWSAAEKAKVFNPDIVILDIGMPRVDGYEAARQIREQLGGRVVLVALTGWGQDDDKRRSREAGFDHHLTKPPDPETLDRLIVECGRGRVEKAPSSREQGDGSFAKPPRR